jgi:hypothetical protein
MEGEARQGIILVIKAIDTDQPAIAGGDEDEPAR